MVKSTAGKKHARKARKLLENVPEQYEFRCCDGRRLKNLKELCVALETMPEETYFYHANSQKSDFCNSARDIIRDEVLASSLGRCPNREDAAHAVAARIAVLSNGRG